MLVQLTLKNFKIFKEETSLSERKKLITINGFIVP